MFLTKECDYAIRIVRALADKEVKFVKTICESEFIPHAFAYKILKKMEKEGIVKSYRGIAGGYQLVKDPSKLTLIDIVQAVDKNLLLNECLRDAGESCPNNANGNYCNVHRELIRAQGILIDTLSEKTMKELASKEKMQEKLYEIK